MQITVLGSGLVGRAIVEDLAREPDVLVTVVDRSREALDVLEGNPRVKGIRADLGESGSIANLVADCDLVISAVPGSMGFETLKGILEAGRSVVDISFFVEDAFLLDDLAKSKGLTAVVDCGVAPGLCNILAGHVDSILDQVDRYVCYVGGLPLIRRWPFEYRAVFSPADVMEEYTRPVHLVEYGKEVVRPALSDVELRDFPGVGTLEAFNTDGLRSLTKTIKAPFMIEKTLRYPGHANLMRIFRESGFFNTTPCEIGGQKVVPMALTSELLFKQWKLEEGEEDFTVMQVEIEGKKSDKPCRYTYDLLDKYDQVTRTTSMARMTGYTCTIIARQVYGGEISSPGICPPEFIGRRENAFNGLLEGYKERNIQLMETIVKL